MGSCLQVRALRDGYLWSLSRVTRPLSREAQIPTQVVGGTGLQVPPLSTPSSSEGSSTLWKHSLIPATQHGPQIPAPPLLGLDPSEILQNTGRRACTKNVHSGGIYN